VAAVPGRMGSSGGLVGRGPKMEAKTSVVPLGDGVREGTTREGWTVETNGN